MKTGGREYGRVRLFHEDVLFLHNASAVAFGKTTSLGERNK